jgi:hypothetical protein
MGIMSKKIQSRFGLRTELCTSPYPTHALAPNASPALTCPGRTGSGGPVLELALGAVAALPTSDPT